MKGKCIADLKTSHSQESEVDMFTRLQTNFFEKYVKYTLTDHFGQFLRNTYEEYYYKKLTSKDSKAVAMGLYEVSQAFMLEELTAGIQNFLKEKSVAVSSGQFPTAIKFLYCNREPIPNLFRQGQLVYIDVRIKLQVARIEQIPNHIHSLFQRFNIGDVSGKSADHDLEMLLKNYNKEYFNVFVMYYGDIHFNFNGHPTYQTKTIKVGGRNLKLKLFVFYISKVALFDAFRTVNKLSVDCINDLAISFYEIRREKIRNNKLKKINRSSQQPSQKDQGNTVNKTAVVAVGGIVVGIVLAKLLFF